jgi:Periplasmic copper-binding protein (NosD)
MIAGAALGVLLAAAAPEPPIYAAPACPASITACGCTITQPQIYTVANALSASQTTEPICIEIASGHAILNTMGFDLTGSSFGTGIRIDKGADHVIVEGAQETADEEPPPQSTVQQWNIGIEDDADDATILLFSIKNNISSGILLSHVTRSIVGDLASFGNGTDGIEADHSSELEITNETTSGNGEIGLRLDSSNYNHLSTASSISSVVGGLLFSSSNNVVYDFAFVNNSNTGLVLDCNLDRKNCPGNERSDNNYLLVETATANKAGVVIRKHSGGNTVTLGANGGNSGNKMDMVDENSHCDSNVWYNNVGQGNQTCIH